MVIILLIIIKCFCNSYYILVITELGDYERKPIHLSIEAGSLRQGVNSIIISLNKPPFITVFPVNIHLTV